MTTSARALALEMLVGDPTLLILAREVTEALRAAGSEGGIVGGIAVFLHGYARTTADIDVYAVDRRKLADELVARGWVWNEPQRQFEKQGVPVQILSSNDDLAFHPSGYEVRQGIRVVELADLISMKLGSGTKYVHRAQDLADVVRLIQVLKLDKGFTGRIAKAWRKDCQRLVTAVEHGT
ncbi:MAG TPA: hypothetical protein VK348_06760 [Planctomycetota bacterium]|nr:hypothetical protein [Planctomycetota bacterium]